MSDLRVSFPKPCDEPWEKMTPAGCDRVCARCDRVIHDLAQLDIDEAEVLLRADPDTCVRARIGADGTVTLRAGRGIRRMLAVAGVSALLSTGAPVAAQQQPQRRQAPAISGTIDTPPFVRVRVIASTAKGARFRGKVRQNGRYWFKRLPAGNYTLTFHPDCGDAWRVENVVVRDDAPVVLNTTDENGCIMVGKLFLEDDNARSV